MKTSIVTVLGLLAAGTVAPADVFDWPPETHAPVWQTPFPYQRNVNLGFGVNPVAAPGLGIPGAVYEGWLDPQLMVGDYVQLSGAVQWFDTLAGFTQTGLVGIDNRAGASPLSGWLTIRLDNTTSDLPTKHLWTEQDSFGTTGQGSIGLAVSDPRSILR